MKRNMCRDCETSKKTKRDGVTGDHFAWNLVIRKLDYRSQMKIAQQNQHLAEVVDNNATHELKKYRRCLQEDKYMCVYFESFGIINGGASFRWSFSTTKKINI